MSSWIPSWTLTVLVHFHKDFMLSELMSCRVIRCIPFPPKCLHEGQIHRQISSIQSQSLSHSGIAVGPRSLICLSANRVSSGTFGQKGLPGCFSLWTLVFSIASLHHIFRSWENRMTCSTSGSCNVLSRTIGLFIMFANSSLSDSFWPRITLHLNSFSVSRLTWVRRRRSGSSLPLKRCLALCVRSTQTKDQVHRELDVNSDCTPTSTWEAKNKLLLQRDAVGDICTNRTFQLQPEGTRNNVCISRVCMPISTCTCPIFAGFSTCETFLAFAFALSRLL